MKFYQTIAQSNVALATYLIVIYSIFTGKKTVKIGHEIWYFKYVFFSLKIHQKIAIKKSVQ